MPSPTLNTKCVFYEDDKVNHTEIFAHGIAYSQYIIRSTYDLCLCQFLCIRVCSGLGLFRGTLNQIDRRKQFSNKFFTMSRLQLKVKVTQRERLLTSRYPAATLYYVSRYSCRCMSLPRSLLDLSIYAPNLFEFHIRISFRKRKQTRSDSDSDSDPDPDPNDDDDVDILMLMRICRAI